MTAQEAGAELTKPGAEFEVELKVINGIETRVFKNISPDAAGILQDLLRRICGEDLRRLVRRPLDKRKIREDVMKTL